MATLFNPQGSLVPLHLFRKRLSEGADPNELWQSWRPDTLDSQQPIPQAARYSVGHLELLLAHAKIDLRAAYQCGRDALATAVLFGNNKTIPRLIAAGAPVNTTDTFGATPLHYAAHIHGADAMRLLLECGADPNISGPNGRSPLHEVVMEYTIHPMPLEAKLACLLAGDANPNVRDDNGKTPLHYAATSGFVRITLLLLAAGADPDVRDDAGDRPEDALRCQLDGAVHPQRLQALQCVLGTLLEHRRARLVAHVVQRPLPHALPPQTSFLRM